MQVLCIQLSITILKASNNTDEKIKHFNRTTEEFWDRIAKLNVKELEIYFKLYLNLDVI